MDDIEIRESVIEIVDRLPDEALRELVWRVYTGRMRYSVYWHMGCGCLYGTTYMLLHPDAELPYASTSVQFAISDEFVSEWTDYWQLELLTPLEEELAAVVFTDGQRAMHIIDVIKATVRDLLFSRGLEPKEA